MKCKAETMPAMFRWPMVVLLAGAMLAAAGPAHGWGLGGALMSLFAGGAAGGAAGTVAGAAAGAAAVAAAGGAGGYPSLPPLPPLPPGEGVYEGERNPAGDPHGEGVKRWPDGTEIECVIWVKGKAHGPCRILRPNGKGEAGMWCNGRPCGKKFDLEWPGGRKWKGGARNGKPHGKGVMESPDGGRYEGDVRDGEPHGEGVMVSSEGSYEGQWCDGYPCRYGVRTWPDGRRYEGEFRIGDPYGQGVMTWPDGRRHEGAFRIGSPHGYGVATWPDGRRIEGEYRYGVLPGKT